MRLTILRAHVALIPILLAGFGLERAGATPGPEKYAVLVATEETNVDDVPNNTEFWHDLVLTYCTLRENGFKSENIFVLYGDGVDYPGDSRQSYRAPYCDKSTKITDLRLTSQLGTVKDNICNILCCLAEGVPATQPNGECACSAPGGTGAEGAFCSDNRVPWLTAKDFLFVWVKGHGSEEDACHISLSLANTIENTHAKFLKDSELANLLKCLAADRRVLVFETCDSEGWLGDLTDKKSVVIASSYNSRSDSCLGASSWAGYPEYYEYASAQSDRVFHGRFTYWMNAALRQQELTGTPVPSDADNNNLVSIQEVHCTTEMGLCAENQKYSPPVQQQGQTISEVCGWEPPIIASDLKNSQIPAISDESGIAPCIFVRLPEPGRDTEVFSMDHVHDNGTIPSDSEPWFHGPDLWVRNTADGATTHQEPIYGQTNYVYGRVHNIGCVRPPEVSVAFSWVEPTGWALQSMWNAIGTATIPGPPVGSPQTVHVAWPNVPLPGAYCLHATLTAEGDPPNADGRVFLDNNKVQVNVSVLAMASGLFSGGWLWVANWSKDSRSVDLSLDASGLLPGTRVRVEFPPDLRLVDPRGVWLSLSPDGWSVLELEAPETKGVPGADRPSLARILLPPGERSRAIVSVAMPRTRVTGMVGTLRLEERVDNEVKGGVDFVVRPSTLEDAACDLVRTCPPILWELTERSGYLEAASEFGKKRLAVVRGSKCAHEKELPDLVSRMAVLEPWIAKSLAPEVSVYGERYRRAGTNAREASLRKDWPATLEAAQEQFLFATIILAEMRKR